MSIETAPLDTQTAGGAPPPRKPNLFGISAANPDWKSLLPLCVIVLVGLVLRLWGIGWSLPDARHPLATYHPDELLNLGVAMSADLPHLKFDIRYYNYGALYFYLVSFAQTFGRAYGLIPAPGSGMASQAHAMAALFLAGRLVTALLGTATVGVLFALGSRLYSRSAGYAAALLYALAPLAVVHAHFLTVDVPATFLVTLTLLFSARILERQTWSNYALAGVSAGLAAATKYNAGLVLIAPIVAHLLNRVPNACSRHRGAQFVVLLCMAAIAFLVGCPGPILDLDAFWDGIPEMPNSGMHYELFVHSHTGHGALFIDTGAGWWYHLMVSLPAGLGLPLLLLALAGLVYAGMRRTKGDWVLLAFFLLYYGTTGLSAVRFARYMIPLFPVLCLLGARIATETFPRAATQRLCRVGGVAVACLTALTAVTLCMQMARTDPRDAAADALDARAPQGASIAFATVPWFYSPPLSPYFGALAASRRRTPLESGRYRFLIPEQEWDPAVLSPPPDVVVLSNIETMHVLDRLHQVAPTRFFAAIPKDYLTLHFTPGFVFGLPLRADIVPEDLLYILPVVTLYTRPGALKP
jgi:4-amino-4-deoxy-L-arabinose transferase-like glycosyltransferase